MPHHALESSKLPHPKSSSDPPPYGPCAAEAAIEPSPEPKLIPETRDRQRERYDGIVLHPLRRRVAHARAGVLVLECLQFDADGAVREADILTLETST
jgi:hypothetical protein